MLRAGRDSGAWAVCAIASRPAAPDTVAGLQAVLPRLAHYHPACKPSLTCISKPSLVCILGQAITPAGHGTAAGRRLGQGPPLRHYPACAPMPSRRPRGSSNVPPPVRNTRQTSPGASSSKHPQEQHAAPTPRRSTHLATPSSTRVEDQQVEARQAGCQVISQRLHAAQVSKVQLLGHDPALYVLKISRQMVSTKQGRALPQGRCQTGRWREMESRQKPGGVPVHLDSWLQLLGDLLPRLQAARAEDHVGTGMR